MPELPEVETVRRQLAPRVVGRRIARIEVSDPRWCDPIAPRELVAAVSGRRVVELDRRGKYLIWQLDDELYLVMHLRMTGNLLYDAAPDAPYIRVAIELDDGHSVRFSDPRRFGTGTLIHGHAALELYFSARLGPEPFSADFTTAALRERARHSRAPVKAFLLDQKRIAGVGNIYADEALFRARIHPLRAVGTLTRRQFDELREAVIDSLAAGIDARGASIDDFRDPDGARGSFQDRFLVHRREGEPCPRCGTTIEKIVAAGRGTYVCRRCQPRPRKTPAARSIIPRAAR